MDEPIVVYSDATTTNKNWFYADHLGSIVALANTTGAATANYTYSAEGKQGGSTASSFGYTGQQNLAGLGVQYYKARMYSADLGRFIQTDPIGMADDMNLYAYVGNNAVNRTDPSGKLSFPWHFGITYWAARDEGMGFVDSLGLAWNAMAVDFRVTQGTDSASTAQHMMSGINSFNEYDSPEIAMQNGQMFINQQLQESIFSTNSFNLGNAGHAVEDKYTDSHMGSIWDGFSDLGFWGTIDHVIKDTFPSLSNIGGAYSETRALINSSMNGNPDSYLNSPYNLVRGNGK